MFVLGWEPMMGLRYSSSQAKLDDVAEDYTTFQFTLSLLISPRLGEERESRAFAEVP